MKSNYKPIGNYIEEVDVRNETRALGANDLFGLSVNKTFIESHANLVGVDFKSYKIVEPDEFCYIPVTSRNGNKVSIAKNDFGKRIIVSSAYVVFKIKYPKTLIPDYLMLLLSDTEFDRYARYNSWGSAREVFAWEDFCNTCLSIPTPEEQQECVDRFGKIRCRKVKLEKTIDLLLETIKNSYCLLTKNKNYNGKIGDIIVEMPKSSLQVGDADLSNIYPFFTSGESILSHSSDLVNGFNLFLNTGGKFGVNFYDGKASYSTDTWCIRGKEYFSKYLYCLIIDNFDRISSDECFRGSALKHLNKDDMKNIKIYLPNNQELISFNNMVNPLFKLIGLYREEIKLLNNVGLLLINSAARQE